MGLVSGLYRWEVPTERYENTEEGARRVRRAVQRLIVLQGQEAVLHRLQAAVVPESQRGLRATLIGVAWAIRPGQSGGTF